ncbi:MAG: AAA family ATPase [Candidatus Colwellbacteria bacterium]|nr:AAA family ATPase [Candidatus Colwellbacteria bacterium]
MKEIKRIVITGGPCGGKTEGISYVREKLAEHGWFALEVRESATELQRSGLILNAGHIDPLSLARHITRMQIEKENRFHNIANDLAHQKIVLLHDRGLMDVQAYISPTEFVSLLAAMQKTMPEMRDMRYDAVFHCVSAAIGAEDFYNTATNKARYETPEEARERDRKTQNAWVGHPHLRVIDNSTDFAGKKERLYAGVCRALGIPEPREIQQKYIIKKPNIASIAKKWGIHFAAIDVEQIYLISRDGLQKRIRKGGQNGSYTYYICEKREVKPGVRMEEGKKINDIAYSHYALNERAPKKDIIRKTRYYFLWKGQYFELDIFKEPKRLKGTALLEIELENENDSVSLPPFLEVIREITDDPKFTNYALAESTENNK